MGLLEVAQTSVLLLIAVRVFDASVLEKSLLSIGGSIGHLGSPTSVAIFSRQNISASRGAAILFFLASLALLIAATTTSSLVFALAGMSAGALSNASHPLITQMYQENYHEHERGKLFAIIATVRIAILILASWIFGVILDNSGEATSYVLLIFVAAAIFAVFCLSSCQTHILATDGRRFSILPSFAPVRTDRLFRVTLISWMFLGFGNLMMVPLRIEYLANPRYGFNLSSEQVLLIASAIPNLSRLTLNRTFGRIFDTFGFLNLRLVLNTSLAIGTAAFFISGDISGLIVGAVLLGVSFAGGDVLWALWVTKVAPPEKVAQYMSIHSFLTGIRGVIAPYVGFSLTHRFGIAITGTISMSLILISVSLLLPDAIKHYRDTKNRGVVKTPAR